MTADVSGNLTDELSTLYAAIYDPYMMLVESRDEDNKNIAA